MLNKDITLPLPAPAEPAVNVTLSVAPFGIGASNKSLYICLDKSEAPSWISGDLYLLPVVPNNWLTKVSGLLYSGNCSLTISVSILRPPIVSGLFL